MRLRGVLVVMLSISVVQLTFAQKFIDEIKTWHLPVGMNEVEVRLSSYGHAGQPQNTVVSLRPEQWMPITTVATTFELLELVFSEMPALGYDPAKLLLISFPSEGSEFESGANLVVAGSGEWKHCIGLKYCHSIERFINEYLNTSGGFEKLDLVLKAHHLARGRVFIDDVTCALRPKNAARAADVGDGALSCAGIIFVNVQKRVE